MSFGRFLVKGAYHTLNKRMMEGSVSYTRRTPIIQVRFLAIMRAPSI